VLDVREKTSAECGYSTDDSGHDEHMGLLERTYKRQCIEEHDKLEEYLNAVPDKPQTDMLQWWKANTVAYLCLAAMARDYPTVTWPHDIPNGI
jgi:hypothetical protein